MFLKYEEGRVFRFGYYLLGSFILVVFNFIGQIPLLIYFITSLANNSEEINPSMDPMELLNIIPSNTRLFLMLFPFAFTFIGLWLIVKKIHEKSMNSIVTSRKKLDFGRIIFAFSLWAFITVTMIFYDYITSPENYLWNFQPVPFLIMFLIAIIFIPLQTSIEEYVFRGYLMQGIGVFFRNRWIPLFLTSLMFGLLHYWNPEVTKLGTILLIHYFFTGLFLGILTIMDDGMELSLGFHAGNNLLIALIVTADWTVFQTTSIFKYIGEPDLINQSFFTMIVVYPILLLYFSLIP